MRQERDRIHTSIVTIQEVSVLSYVSLGAARISRTDKISGDENYIKVNRLARIHGITKDVALLAAKLEALMLTRMQTMTREKRQALSPRRKWTAFASPRRLK